MTTTDLEPGHIANAHQTTSAELDPTPGREKPDAQTIGAAGGEPLELGGHFADDTPRSAAGELDPSPTAPATSAPTPTQAAPARWADAAVLIAADMLDDVERVRIATENRHRSLVAAVDEHGKGLAGHPLAAQLADLVDGLADLERRATRTVEKAMKDHPLAPMIEATPGLGLKQTGRLLAAIGDPYWHPEGRPRTVSELWALCGYHVIAGSAPRRAKGQRANWSNTAKMRAHLVAASCIKQTGANNRPRSPYRDVYDDGVAKYSEAVHAEPCRRCGPAGHPAPEGSPLSPGHRHARAMRLTAKAILRDLWRAARELHPTDQRIRDAHIGAVGGVDHHEPADPTTIATQGLNVAELPHRPGHTGPEAHSCAAGAVGNTTTQETPTP